MSDDGYRVNFTDVDSTRSFDLLPNGRYIGELTDYKEGVASESAKNAGAPTINWEFTLESTIGGDEVITDRKTGKDIKVEGRRVWDNLTIVEGSFYRLKNLLEACGFEAEGEVKFDPKDVLNERVVLFLGQQKNRKNKDTGEEYDDRNIVKRFEPLPEDGTVG